MITVDKDGTISEITNITSVNEKIFENYIKGSNFESIRTYFMQNPVDLEPIINLIETTPDQYKKNIINKIVREMLKNPFADEKNLNFYVINNLLDSSRKLLATKLGLV